MSEAEKYRRWFARRIWPGRGCAGWASEARALTKADKSVLRYWRNHGHIEDDDYGMIRLTAAGRKSLGLDPI